MKNFVEELRWRGMLAQMMPGTEELLQKEMVTAYLGTDPTADSLHIGHLCGIMMLRHLQRCGHKPIILVGGATGMIGDPSGKSQERNLLNEETLRHNQECIKKQVAKFLDFESKEPNAAEMVNNYDWMKDFTFLDFAREVGKHITVNYMMAKDNITTGTELIRRTLGFENEAFALTCPLITKADGKKFGKTESGNIWLDPKRTTPYKFYQFWLNVSDEDAERYIKIFTSLEKDVIDALVEEHKKDPGMRVLQKRLAQEVTVLVHSQEALDAAIEASNILFGKATKDALEKLDEDTFLDVFDGVPQEHVSRTELEAGLPIVDFMAVNTQIFPSKNEARKMTQANGVSVNKEKVTLEKVMSLNDLIDGKYILVQKGKKNYYLVVVE